MPCLKRSRRIPRCELIEKKTPELALDLRRHLGERTASAPRPARSSGPAVLRACPGQSERLLLAPSANSDRFWGRGIVCPCDGESARTLWHRACGQWSAPTDLDPCQGHWRRRTRCAQATGQNDHHPNGRVHVAHCRASERSRRGPTPGEETFVARGAPVLRPFSEASGLPLWGDLWERQGCRSAVASDCVRGRFRFQELGSRAWRRRPLDLEQF